MAEVWNSLTKEKQQKFSQLYSGAHKNEEVNTLHNHVRLNGWSLNLGLDKSSVFWGFSFVNHSCQPNCLIDSDEDGNMFLIAIAPISGGQTEILVSYLHYAKMLDTCKKRRCLTEQSWGFTCCCTVGSHNDLSTEHNLMEEKRSRIKEFLRYLDLDDFETENYDIDTTYGRWEAGARIEEFVVLLEEIRMVELLGKAFVLAIIIFNFNPDLQRRRSKMMEFHARVLAYDATYRQLSWSTYLWNKSCTTFRRELSYPRLYEACLDIRNGQETGASSYPRR